MTLSQVYERFPGKEDCLKYLEQVLWKGEPCCPYCSFSSFSSLKDEHRYHCNVCNASFSITVGTLFHRSHTDLQKWFFAISLVTSHKKISARTLAQEVGVNKNTALNMKNKIRRALLHQDNLIHKLMIMFNGKA